MIRRSQRKESRQVRFSEFEYDIEQVENGLKISRSLSSKKRLIQVLERIDGRLLRKFNNRLNSFDRIMQNVKEDQYDYGVQVIIELMILLDESFNMYKGDPPSFVQLLSVQREILSKVSKFSNVPLVDAVKNKSEINWLSLQDRDYFNSIGKSDRLVFRRPSNYEFGLLEQNIRFLTEEELQGLQDILPANEGYQEIDIRSINSIAARNLIRYVKKCVKKQGRDYLHPLKPSKQQLDDYAVQVAEQIKQQEKELIDLKVLSAEMIPHQGKSLDVGKLFANFINKGNN